MNVKKIVAMLMSLTCIFTVMFCCPLTASAAYEKDPWHWSSSEPTRAIYYKSPTMTGNDVKWVQAALNRTINAGLKIDGSFGPACKTATKKFQKEYGLSQDGSFGPATRSKMIDALNSVGCYKVVSISNGTYTFKSGLNNNYCIDLASGATNNGSNIQIYTGNNTNSQKFTATNLGNGWYSIRHAQSKKAVDVAGGVSNKVANVQLYDYNGSSAQQYRFIYAGGGYYYIQNRGGLFLDVSGGKANNGTNIQVYWGNQTASQKWKLAGTSLNTNTNGSSSSKITTAQIQSVLNKYGYSTGKYWTYKSGGSPTSSYVATNRQGRKYSYKYNGVECYGFANFVMHEVTGTTVNPNNGNKNGWKYIKASDVRELKVGDIVRIGKSNSNGHSGVVLTVDNNGKCTFAQCFGGVNNKISIGTSLASSSFGSHNTLSSMKNRGVLLYVYRYVG